MSKFKGILAKCRWYANTFFVIQHILKKQSINPTNSFIIHRLTNYVMLLRINTIFCLIQFLKLIITQWIWQWQPIHINMKCMETSYSFSIVRTSGVTCMDSILLLIFSLLMVSICSNQTVGEIDASCIFHNTLHTLANLQTHIQTPISSWPLTGSFVDLQIFFFSYFCFFYFL